MEHLLLVEMYAMSLFQTTDLLVPLHLCSGMLDELIKLLIPAKFCLKNSHKVK
jgi:hypothetical protein